MIKCLLFFGMYLLLNDLKPIDSVRIEFVLSPEVQGDATSIPRDVIHVDIRVEYWKLHHSNFGLYRVSKYFPEPSLMGPLGVSISF